MIKKRGEETVTDLLGIEYVPYGKAEDVKGPIKDFLKKMGQGNT